MFMETSGSAHHCLGTTALGEQFERIINTCDIILIVPLHTLAECGALRYANLMDWNCNHWCHGHRNLNYTSGYLDRLSLLLKPVNFASSHPNIYIGNCHHDMNLSVTGTMGCHPLTECYYRKILKYPFKITVPFFIYSTNFRQSKCKIGCDVQLNQTPFVTGQDP